MSAVRPTAWQWVKYAYGAGLPDVFDDWVLRDTTGASWVWRHLARALVQIAPIVIVVILFLPGPEWIRLVAVVAGTAMALLFSIAYIVESNDRRLAKAGFAQGVGERTRQRRARETQAVASAQRRARAERRRAARG
jgi:hypothetical protein